MHQLGCSVPLYVVLFQPVYSVIPIFGKFTLQSTAPFMQTLSFQFCPVAPEKLSLRNVVLETTRSGSPCCADRVIVRNAESFRIPGLDLTVPQRDRQSRRSRRTWLVAERRHVPKKTDAHVYRRSSDRLWRSICLSASPASTRHDVVIAYIRACPGNGPAVRRNHLPVGQNGLRQRAEAVHWNLVVRENASRERSIHSPPA